jgi:hypothetical protein
MNWTTLRDHIGLALASAAMLGGGATIISNKLNIAVLEERVDRLEDLNANVVKLREELQLTREELIRSQRDNPNNS